MATATREKKKAKSTNLDRLKAIRPEDGLIPLRPFLIYTNQKSHSWGTAKRKAEKLGITLAYQHGRQVFVDAAAWVKFLMSNPAPITEPRCNDGDLEETSDDGFAEGNNHDSSGPP
jgi:hypothetical protein